MNYLVDTQALLWWDAQAEKLSAPARKLFEDPTTTLTVSHATVWEIAIKNRIGKLTLPCPLEEWLHTSVIDAGFLLAPISLTAIIRTTELPMHHGDPFDRLLIAQALDWNCPAISADDSWDVYGITRIW